jgi:hypothetical protein
MHIQWSNLALAPLPGYVSNYVPCPGASVPACWRKLGLGAKLHPAIVFDDEEGGGARCLPLENRSTGQPLHG